MKNNTGLGDVKPNTNECQENKICATLVPGKTMNAYVSFSVRRRFACANVSIKDTTNSLRMLSRQHRGQAGFTLTKKGKIDFKFCLL